MLFKSDSTGLCKTYSSRRYTTQFHTRRTYVQHAASVKHDNPARPAGSRARRRASRRAGDRRCWEHGQHRQLGKQRQQWVPPSCDRFRFSPISYSIWLCLCVFFFISDIIDHHRRSTVRCGRSIYRVAVPCIWIWCFECQTRSLPNSMHKPRESLPPGGRRGQCLQPQLTLTLISRVPGGRRMMVHQHRKSRFMDEGPDSANSGFTCTWSKGARSFISVFLVTIIRATVQIVLL